MTESAAKERLIRSFAPEERGFLEQLERFAAEVLVPAAAEADARAAFVADQLAGLARLGAMGANLPAEWGGGLSPEALVVAVATVAGACASTASALTAHYLATDAVLLGGSAAQHARYLPPAAAGESLGAFALTEPAAGSNPADMRCRAEPCGAGYRLSGRKCFISNGGVADFVVVFAVSDPSRGHRGISAFVVERGTAGFSAGPPERTMGLRGGHVFELELDCTVPAASRLGEEGSGFRLAMQVLDRGRIEVAAMCLGIAEAALAFALARVRERRVGGVPLAERQGVRWMLADMALALEAARALTLEAARQRREGGRFTLAAAMAKLHASEMVHRVTDAALQLHGGYGYCRDLPLERLVRDARVMRIYEGASEVQRDIIARHLLG